MIRISRALSVTLVVALSACGGGSSPSGPTPQPSPSTVPGATVVATLYYDENQDGRAEAGEAIRIPDVEVSIGGRTARSEKTTGRAVVTGVPAGTQTVTLRADTVPPFYALQQLSTTVQVSLPEGGQVMVALTLPIENNQTNVYMAFGDSITRGDGGTSGGYPADLQNRLAAHFGGAFVNNRGADSTNSFEGVERVRRNLNGRPAYTLIVYGTNDWNAPRVPGQPELPHRGQPAHDRAEREGVPEPALPRDHSPRQSGPEPGEPQQVGGRREQPGASDGARAGRVPRRRGEGVPEPGRRPQPVLLRPRPPQRRRVSAHRADVLRGHRPRQAPRRPRPPCRSCFAPLPR